MASGVGQGVGEDLLDGEWRGLRQSEQACRVRRRGTRTRIGDGEELRQPGARGGIVGQQLRPDRRTPTAAAQVRLADGFDLLGEIQSVQVGMVDRLAGRPAAQQRRLLLGPEDEILVVAIAHVFRSWKPIFAKTRNVCSTRDEPIGSPA